MRLRAAASLGLWGRSCGLRVAILILGPVVVGSAASVLAAVSIPLGSLTVRSQPGVEVIWDDVTLGTTDRQGVMEIGGIPPGSYTLLLGKQGIEAQPVLLQISAGAQALNLSLTAPPAASVWPTALAAVVMVLAGITILRLARRRPQVARPVPEMAGPKVVMGSPGRRSNRSSMLLRDLKRREDSLENYVEAGTGGLKRKVINVEVVDHQSVEPRPVDDAGGEDR